MASEYTKGLIKQFVNEHGLDIANAIADTGLFMPSVVAQLSVESQNGESDLASSYNNYGGIKGNSGNGVRLDTFEGNTRRPKVAWFKKYDNFPAFMKDYVQLLLAPRYIQAGILDAETPEDQIIRLVQGGYSTMSPDVYLKNGVQDRIDAFRDISGFGGKIYSPQNQLKKPIITPIDESLDHEVGYLDDINQNLGDNAITTDTAIV